MKMLPLIAGIVFGCYVAGFMVSTLAAWPNPGHPWNQIECTTVFCVWSFGQKTDIGNANPTQKLSVSGGEVLLTTPAGGGIVPLFHLVNPGTAKDWVFKHADSKFHLQTETTGGSEVLTLQDNGLVGIGTVTPTVKLEVAGDMKIAGKLNECALPHFVGTTVNTHDGNLGGYAGADAICNTDWPGSHVCSNDEILRSNRCGFYAGGSNSRTNAYVNARGKAWVSGVATEKTLNDCAGWTSSSSSYSSGGGLDINMLCSTLYVINCCK